LHSVTGKAYQKRKAALSLKVIIVGGGLGGLAAAYCLGQAGHEITVVESASAISDVGAGIQLGPNLTRLLLRWGLGEKLKHFAVVPEAISFRRCEQTNDYWLLSVIHVRLQMIRESVLDGQG
jgi:salicylate hydroxylase